MTLAIGGQLAYSTSTVIIVLAIVIGIAAIAVFYLNVGAYQRRSGYAIHIAALKTLIFVIVMAAVIALTWWLSTLCFNPGMWRNLAAFVFYSILMGVLGSPAMKLGGRIVERWYYM